MLTLFALTLSSWNFVLWVACMVRRNNAAVTLWCRHLGVMVTPIILVAKGCARSNMHRLRSRLSRYVVQAALWLVQLVMDLLDLLVSNSRSWLGALAPMTLNLTCRGPREVTWYSGKLLV